MQSRLLSQIRFVPVGELRSRGRGGDLTSVRRVAKSGMTMVELMISIVILTLCCTMLASTLSATGVHRATNYEEGLAVEAARGVVEDMHNWTFGAIYATYNDDPTDDPDGEGTAPGKHFDVVGLRPTDGDLDGFVGEIILPVDSGPLYENTVNPDLGMPRDLNGDVLIDAGDHTDDHIILPVCIEIRWQGKGGDRTMRIDTLLADCGKEK